MTGSASAGAAREQSVSFEVTHASGRSGPRVGRLRTAHGTCETPCFLPIATHGSLRALTFDEAAECGTRVVMANAWHLYREAGPAALQEAGGAHALMNWQGILFTDSGGYQVFSLRGDSEIGDAGVRFGGDGDSLSPEHVVHMQKVLGSDVMMVLDDCAPFPCSRERAVDAVRRTSLWASLSMRAHQEAAPCYGRAQQLWGIVQGGEHSDLRKQSAEEVAQLEFDGYGLGGLSIGMPRDTIRELTRLQSDLLPFDKPRHLLGVGLPPQILDGIEDGADTFDCVLPIRKAQRGHVYTSSGELAYKKPQPAGAADGPVDSRCECSTCRSFSCESLRRLYKTDKQQAGRLAAFHNLSFYHKVLQGAREAIGNDRFAAYKTDLVSRFSVASDRRS